MKAQLTGYEDTMRVIAVSCLRYAQDNPPTRDTAITLQIAGVISHACWPDDNPAKTMRITDEPLPVCKVV